MMGWGNQGYGMWGMGGFGMMIMMVFFWAIIIIGTILIIRYFTAGQTLGRKESSPYEIHSEPLQILRQRYAKGEIDNEEFEERKRTLEGEG